VITKRDVTATAAAAVTDSLAYSVSHTTNTGFTRGSKHRALRPPEHSQFSSSVD